MLTRDDRTVEWGQTCTPKHPVGPADGFRRLPGAQTADRIYDNQTRAMLQRDQDSRQVSCLGKGWNMLFRLDGPLDPWFDKTWKLSEIQRLD